jgi:hypothetical protein
MEKKEEKENLNLEEKYIEEEKQSFLLHLYLLRLCQVLTGRGQLIAKDKRPDQAHDQLSVAIQDI